MMLICWCFADHQKRKFNSWYILIFYPLSEVILGKKLLNKINRKQHLECRMFCPCEVCNVQYILNSFDIRPTTHFNSSSSVWMIICKLLQNNLQALAKLPLRPKCFHLLILGNPNMKGTCLCRNINRFQTYFWSVFIINL